MTLPLGESGGQGRDDGLAVGGLFRFELYWNRDRRGDRRVMKRTARQKLQPAKQRMKNGIKANRHLPERQFIKELNRKRVGHYILSTSVLT